MHSLQLASIQAGRQPLSRRERVCLSGSHPPDFSKPPSLISSPTYPLQRTPNCSSPGRRQLEEEEEEWGKEGKGMPTLSIGQSGPGSGFSRPPCAGAVGTQAAAGPPPPAAATAAARAKSAVLTAAGLQQQQQAMGRPCTTAPGGRRASAGARVPTATSWRARAAQPASVETQTGTGGADWCSE
ncbi:hypothetical protein TREES_T100008890 [Tupaia chinensis]|uniref:Uncharacterized protein n=1 Tax=Tupaia chinensis TaxID=246437 RepID=L9L1P7_TUPCH|nr:hypothetical protein TREES_T100008890 [Tupaia chinensis]